MAEEPIGTITHYFKKPGAAVINLDKPLAAGERIRIHGQTTDFEQTVDSMEVDHQRIKTARPGDNVAFKVAGRVRPGDKVFRLGEEASSS